MKASFKLPIVVSAAILPFIMSVSLAQQSAPKPSAKSDAKAGDVKTGKPRAKPRGRLPAYYTKVVDGQQREKIYAIQQQYEPKISALKAELQALQDQVDAEVEAVLTPEQRDIVKKLADDAKAKRKSSVTSSAAASSEGPEEGDDSAEESAADAKAAPTTSKPAATGGKSGK